MSPSTNNQIGVTVVGHDQATEAINRVHRSVSNLERAFGSLRARFVSGVVFGLGYRALNLFDEGIRRIADAIPDLIHRGQAWADTVDRISDITGMSAEQSSELAAVQQYLNGSTDTLGRSLVMLARNAKTNADSFRELGLSQKEIQQAGTDPYAFFQRVRQAVNATGASYLSTARAQGTFGRGVQDILDLLQLSDPEWARYAEQARRSGLIISQAGRLATEEWKRQQNVLGAAITGLGAQVAVGVAPVLTSFVNGVTRFIQDNMQSIVRFVSQVVGFVVGALSGLFGITLQMDSFTGSVDQNVMSWQEWRRQFGSMLPAIDKGRSSTDAYTRAIQRQIDALDKQLARMDTQDQREAARREHQQLLADVADAQKQLNEVRSETIFAAGMSEAEAILAEQRHAAEVQAAQKRLADARQNLADGQRRQEEQRERDQLQRRRDALQQQMTDHQKAMGAITRASTNAFGNLRAQYRQYVASTKAASKDMVTSFTGDLKNWVDEATASGRAVADAILTALFGPHERIPGQNVGTTSRTGGLIDKIASFAAAVGGLVDTLNKTFGDGSAIAIGLIGLATLVNPLLGLLVALGAFMAWLRGHPNPNPGGHLFGSPQDEPLFPFMFPDPSQKGVPFSQTGYNPGAWGGDISAPGGQAMQAAYNRFWGPGSTIDQSLEGLQSLLGEGGAIATNTGGAAQAAQDTSDRLGTGITANIPGGVDANVTNAKLGVKTIQDGDVVVGAPSGGIGVKSPTGNPFYVDKVQNVGSNVTVTGTGGGSGQALRVVTTSGDTMNIEGKDGGARIPVGGVGSARVPVSAPKSAPVWVVASGGVGQGKGASQPGLAGGPAFAGGSPGQLPLLGRIELSIPQARRLFRGQTATSTLKSVF